MIRRCPPLSLLPPLVPPLQLHLQEIDIGEEGAKAIAKALHVNASLTSVHAFPTFKPLPFIRFPPLCSACLLSAHTCPFNSRQLNLHQNDIGPEGAKAIGDALRVNASLTSVLAFPF